MPDDGPDAPATSTAPWRFRDFRLYQAARFLGILGAEAQSVGVAWQVYQITHSALALGYTGLALFLPGLVFVLPAGHVADRYDRRSVIFACYTVQALATAALLAFSLHGIRSIWPVYAVLFLIGTGRCFSGPAASALLPSLVPKEHFVNAVTWGSTIFQISNATGPMIGGLLFTIALTRFAGGSHSAVNWLTRLNGAPLVYCFTILCLLSFLTLIALLHPRPLAAAAPKGFSLQTMLAGLHYVRQTRLLLGSLSLDLFAVLLGGATALLPIFAKDVLHSGANGLGLLRAMPSAGALLTSLTLLRHPIRRGAGKKMLLAVGIFGAGTVVFGLSHLLWLSCVALFVTGAADMISVVVRMSILQLGTPPEMRGRVSAVNWLFLGASNEFGEYESGLTAHWWGAVRAVVAGGCASIAVTGLWSTFFPALRRVDRLRSEDLLAAERTLAATEPVR